MKTKKFGNVILFLVPTFLLLAPAGYVIYLLESTVSHERMALKNEIHESYKGALLDSTRKLSEYWFSLEKKGVSEVADPLKVLSEIGSDSVILYNEKGEMVFPLIKRQILSSFSSEAISEAQKKVKNRDIINAINDFLYIGKNSQNTQEQAIAFLEAAVLLHKIEKPRDALELCNLLLFDDKFREVSDGKGNLIYFDAILLFLEIEPAKSELENKLLETVIVAINDYSNKKLTTEQRVDLRHKLLKLYPNLYFPFQQPEEHALFFLSMNSNPERRNILQKSIRGELWQYAIQDNVILLFTTENLEDKMLSLIQFAEIPDKTMLRLNPPSLNFDLADTIVHVEATNKMPGWKISLNFIDPDYLSKMVNQRIKIYHITTLLVIIFSALLFYLFLRIIRQKLQLADLKNDLVANVTHELKTPLASSRVLLDTLLSQPHLSEEKMKSYLGHLSTENNRLCRLVEHFLAFSKLEKNQYKFHMKIFSIDELIDALNEAIQGRLSAEKERIVSVCTEEEVYLTGDIQTLVMVIVNLLENGLKFSSSEKNVFLTIEKEEAYLKISVKDEGIGIAKSEQSKIFEQYYQVDNLLSRKYEGSGLGLNIVKTILEAHQSKILIESELGRGSCFSFSLKIEKQSESEV